MIPLTAQQPRGHGLLLSIVQPDKSGILTPTHAIGVASGFLRQSIFMKLARHCSLQMTMRSLHVKKRGMKRLQRFVP
jgi:hypothetical protein